MEVCQRHQLDNGLEVLFIPTHHAPVVALQAWIRFGAADETQETAGIAHLFEHLLFKGTKKRGVGEIAKEVEGLGGDLNAFTTYDHTVMHLTLGKAHLEQGLDILSDALMNSQVDPEELEREKKVIIEEIKRRNDKPASHSADLMRAHLFAGHPYHRPVIGFESVVASLSREKILETYRTYYNSKNIFLALAGDFRPEEAKSIIKKYFHAMPSGISPGERSSLKTLSKPEILFERSNTSNTLAHLCWRGVSAKSADSPALDALCFILGQSESSRLVKSLVHEHELVRDVGAWSWSPKDQGSIEIDLRFAAETNSRFPKVLQCIQECLLTPFTQDELDRAKKNILAGAITSKESVDGLAQRFAYFESVTGDWANDLRFHEQIKDLTVEDLERVRKQYLNWDDVLIAGVYPEKASRPLTPRLLPSTPKFRPKAPRHKEGKVYKFSHHGLTVIVKPHHHIPLFSLRWVGLGGSRLEPAHHCGLGAMWARCVDTGCVSREGKRLDRGTINKIFDDLSADLQAFHGRNSYGFYLDGMSEDFDRLFGIFSDIYHSPTFDEKEFHQEKKQQQHQIRSLVDNPTAILSNLFNAAMFPNHPYGRSSRGEIATIKRLSSTTIAGYHKKLLKEPQVLCVVGDVTPDRVQNALEKVFSRLKISPRPKSVKAKLAKTPKKDIVSNKVLSKEQSHLLYGFPTDGLFSKHRYALQGLAALLSGQGGRLFLELRDKLSLCYSVGPSQMEGLDGGYFAFYIGTSPDKESLALAAIQKEIRHLLEYGVQEQDWQRALRYFVGNHEIEQQHFSSQAFGMALDELYGLGFEEYLEFEKHFSKIRPKEIHLAAKTIFSRPSVLSIVGPKKNRKENFHKSRTKK